MSAREHPGAESLEPLVRRFGNKIPETPARTLTGADAQEELQLAADICIRPWEFAAEPFRIAGGLYYVGNTNVSSHLIDTGDGLILIDTTYPQTVYLLLESIRRLGFDPDDIAYILQSHAHYDHMGGTRAIVELTGARTAMGAADAEMILARPELAWTREYGMEFHETLDTDIPLEDGQVISLGNTSIRCVHTPGHTDGCFSYFFEVSEDGKTYRAGTMGGPGLNTLTDEYLAKYDLQASHRQDYLASVEKLKREHVDIYFGVHPGQSHTFGKRAAMTEEKNPFIEPNEWLGFLDMLERDARASFQNSTMSG